MFLNNFEIGSIQSITQKQSFNHQELASCISLRKKEFQQLGLKEGMLTILLNNNTPQFFIDLLSLWGLGLCVAPMDPAIPHISLQHQIELFGANGLIQTNHRILFFPERRSKTKLPPDSALILFTSGSTKIPRGFVFSFNSILKKIETLSQFIPISDINKTLCALPTFFGHGLICNSLFPLLNGKQLYIEKNFQPSFLTSLKSYCHEHDISFFSSTPAIWSMTKALSLESNPSPTLHNIKRIHCASAPLNQPHIQTMKNWAPQARLFNIYGLTECLGWISGEEITSEYQIGGVGAPWGVAWDVLNNEVSVQAPFLFSGYLEQHHEAMIYQPRTDDAVRTGDRGLLRSNNQLNIIGRLDFIINKAGIKIQPEELESLLIESGLTQEACAFPIEDAVAGQCIGMVVVGQPSLKKDVISFLSNTVPPYKMPDKIWFFDQLPYNSRGKVDRNLLYQTLKIKRGI